LPAPAIPVTTILELIAIPTQLHTAEKIIFRDVKTALAVFNTGGTKARLSSTKRTFISLEVIL
ncbi:TPA: hypothetical protein ACHKJU_004317, partial [Escherichia coli]